MQDSPIVPGGEGIELTEMPEPVILTSQSGQGTARRAAEILVDSSSGGNSSEIFVIPTASQRRTLLVEFAKTGAVIYGRAFDIVKLRADIDLDDPGSVEENLKNIVLCEVKSTKKAADKEFRGHFFSISTAELLVAQSLVENFKFVFVSTANATYREFGLKDVFERIKKVYPTWSVQF